MTKANIRHKAREWTLQYLYQNDIVNENSNDNLTLFYQQLSNHPSTPKKEFEQVKLFTNEYIHAICEKKEMLDKLIKEKLQNWKFSRTGLIDRNIMRLAIYELLFSKTPRAVVISEAIKLAKGFSDKQSPKFINGIIDQIQNETF